jgi:hypothetical protein
MTDPTEGIRRVMVAAINSSPTGREVLKEVLEKEHGQVWDTDELGRDFEVQGFMAPFVVVKRKSDGARGSLMFQHHPRLYWGFTKYDE